MIIIYDDNHHDPHTKQQTAEREREANLFAKLLKLINKTKYSICKTND